MKRKKEQWKPIITNYLKNGETNHDMTGVVIPDGHIFYDVEHSLEKQAKGA
ncbi:BOW99_gp33 family protein [Streptococcus sp. E17BB]|uniref:BOW99_gp33 family protein n=1 Tax=Streptococcus sp. E17BB TaxID=3278714 RepID=UPI00359E01DC